MKYRYYEKSDYKEICTWWESWGWPIIAEQLLPETGIIVYNGDVNLCVGFLYKTDSAVCWIENYLANKVVPKHLRRAGAVDFLIEMLFIEAKEQGFAIAMSSVQHQGLIKKLIRAGCDKNVESNMTNLVKVL